jgi:hypothetical protein
MVLDQSDIDVEFPGLPLDSKEIGYRDNEDAARDTINPDDTAADLAAGGRLDGYKHSFFDPEALFGGASSTERTFGALAEVSLFDSRGSAQAFLLRMVEDFRRFQGIAIDGVTLDNFQELDPPVVGTDAVAFRVRTSAIGLQTTAYSDVVGWVRGPLVATVGVVAVGDADLSEPLIRLVTRMDQRIDGVLAGEISVTPIARAPTATPVSDIGEEAAINEGFDLRAMLVILADLPDGALIESEGFVEGLGGNIAYQREFEAKGFVIELGSSQVMNISATVELHASALDVKGPVLVLKEMDPEVFVEIFGPAFAEGAGFTPEALVVEVLDLPPIGDAVAGFLMKKVETAIGDFNTYFIWLAQGRIGAQMLVMGPAGHVALEDVLPFVELMNERIVEQSP